METAHQILEIGMELGMTPLNLVLMCMLYFMGAHSGIFPKFWGKESQDANKPATKAQMDKLSSYYNHDTTEILKSIDNNVVKVQLAVENLEESIQDLKNQNSEWERFGIPIRNSKK